MLGVLLVGALIAILVQSLWVLACAVIASIIAPQLVRPMMRR
jgi:hypothetical protein